MNHGGHFRRERLPAPKLFYQRELGQLSRPDRKGWVKANCCFHRGKSGTSFSVNLVTGAFRCFGCDVHGWDVLQFVRLRDGVDFRTAAKTLGAWDDGALDLGQRQRLAERDRERRESAAAVDRECQAQKDLRLRYRSEVHFLEEILNDARDTLADRSLAPEAMRFRAAELILQLAPWQLRESVTAYYLLAFGDAADRKRFVAGNERERAAMIANAMLNGVRGMEVSL